jgi:2-dehydropantoate 2-reductase
MSAPRIAVLGAGANGASIGVDLVRAGHDVTLIEQWPEHTQAMRAEGVQIEMPQETTVTQVRVMNVCEVATLRHQFDVVLVLMKAYDTGWACQLIEPYLAPDGLLVCVQNGVTADVAADIVGAHRSLGCVIEISSTMYRPGIVERHSPPARSWFAVGSLCSATVGREEDVASLLRCSGAVSVVEDIRAAKWMKLVSNATTLVTTAIVDMPMREAVAVPEFRALMIRSGNEALCAARSLGHRVLPIFGLRVQDLVEEDHVVEQLLDTLMAGFVLDHTTTTILQDWNKSRRSEAEEINGEVVRVLEAAGQSAPVNAAVLDMARRIESGSRVPSRESLPELLDLAARRITPRPRFS